MKFSQPCFRLFQSARVRETSYAAELGLTASYRLSETTELTAGYQVLWVSNAAMAGSAASGSLLNPTLLRDTVYRDDLLMHGLSVGIRMSF